MKVITQNSGFRHIAEAIFMLLPMKTIILLRIINRKWKEIIDNQMFIFKVICVWKKGKLLSENGEMVWRKILPKFNDVVEKRSEMALVLMKICLNNGIRGSNLHFRCHCPLEVIAALNHNNEYTELAKFLLLQVDEKTCKVVPHCFKCIWCEMGKKSEDYPHQKYLFSPLHLAAMYGYYEEATKIVHKYDSSIHQIQDGWTPMYHAAQFGHIELVKFFNTFTNWPDLDCVWSSPIGVAASHGYLEIVKFLVQQSNHLIEPKLYNRTSLHLAAQYGHYEIVKYLLDFTKNPMAADTMGYTPIHFAAINGSLETIKLLIDYTDNHDVPNNYNQTPTNLAEQHGHKDVYIFLREYQKK